MKIMFVTKFPYSFMLEKKLECLTIFFKIFFFLKSIQMSVYNKYENIGGNLAQCISNLGLSNQVKSSASSKLDDVDQSRTRFSSNLLGN